MPQGRKKYLQKGSSYNLEDQNTVLPQGGSSGSCKMIGGTQPRFKTERQKQMWLRLKAKADAKNKTD